MAGPRSPAISTHRLRRRRWGGWLFAAPAFGLASVALLYPLASNVWLSLHVSRLGPEDGTFVGLKNYLDVIRFGELGAVLINTLLWTLGGMLLQFIVGFSAALALDRGRRGSAILRTLLLTPWIMPGVVVGGIWLTIYNPVSGLANAAFGLVGVGPYDLLGDRQTAMIAVIIANVWKGFPFWMLMIAAGLKAIPHDLYDAARIDGASYLSVIRFITVPMLRATLVVTSALAFVWTFNYFDLVYTMTRGGPLGATAIVPVDIYQTSFQFFRLDQGSSLSVITVAFMAVAIGVYVRVRPVESAA